MSFVPGVVLGGTVRLERPLGAGAIGEVWVATHLRLQAHVAVKVLRAAETLEARARFEQEARIAAQMGSPFAAQVLDCGVTDAGAPFVVMELLRGRDLRARLIEAAGPLPLPETEAVVVQTCRALARAHELGIVHRDVKPANVFLVDAQGAIHCKILDFGVAKVLGPGAMHMTSTGALVGTPNYMSPEQIFHPGAVDHRADLWAVAVIAYVCLTGRLPFQAETLAALSVAMHKGAFVPLRDLRPDLPLSLDAWVRRALAPSSDQRFATAIALSEAFQWAIRSAPDDPVHVSRVSSIAPVYPDGPTALAEALKPAAASPKSASAAGWALGALLALAVVGLGVLGWRAHEGRGDEEAAGEAPGTSKARTDPSGASLGGPNSAPSSSAAPTANAAASATSAPTSRTSVPKVPATTRPSPPPAPAQPKWRKRGMTCARFDQSKSCAACCVPGDRLEAYPSCECMFDGEKWDREHGKAR